jgi:ethanolamine utilization protein EutN
MQLGKVIGHATATIKHRSLNGWRLLLVQPLDSAKRSEGDPLLVLDSVGAGAGDTVVLTSDGKGARELVAAKNSPARWFVMGIVDGD